MYSGYINSLGSCIANRNSINKYHFVKRINEERFHEKPYRTLERDKHYFLFTLSSFHLNLDQTQELEIISMLSDLAKRT